MPGLINPVTWSTRGLGGAHRHYLGATFSTGCSCLSKKEPLAQNCKRIVLNASPEFLSLEATLHHTEVDIKPTPS